MAAKPKFTLSRLEKVCITLMHRLGTREIIIDKLEVLEMEHLEPNAWLDYDYDRFNDKLRIFIRRPGDSEEKPPHIN